MRKKDNSIKIEKIIVDSFLRKGYFYTDGRYNILKALPNNVLCTTIVSNLYGNFLILDVSRIESFIRDDDVYKITMKDDPYDFPLLFPIESFPVSNISGILKRLERFDILLQLS